MSRIARGFPPARRIARAISMGPLSRTSGEKIADTSATPYLSFPLQRGSVVGAEPPLLFFRYRSASSRRDATIHPGFFRGSVALPGATHAKTPSGLVSLRRIQQNNINGVFREPGISAALERNLLNPPSRVIPKVLDSDP